MEWTAEMFAGLAHNAEDPDAAEKSAAILNGTLDPESVDAVDTWVRQCFHRPSQLELVMHALNALLDCHGVEAIHVEGAWVDHYYGDIIATYINTGDAYTETVLLESEGDAFVLTTYGDWLQAWESENERDDDE